MPVARLRETGAWPQTLARGSITLDLAGLVSRSHPAVPAEGYFAKPRGPARHGEEPRRRSGFAKWRRNQPWPRGAPGHAPVSRSGRGLASPHTYPPRGGQFREVHRSWIPGSTSRNRSLARARERRCRRGSGFAKCREGPHRRGWLRGQGRVSRSGPGDGAHRSTAGPGLGCGADGVVDAGQRPRRRPDDARRSPNPAAAAWPAFPRRGVPGSAAAPRRQAARGSVLAGSLRAGPGCVPGSMVQRPWSEALRGRA